MKIIGITGGIGSGKSLVARIMQDKYHAYIVNTDQIAKEQMEPGGISYGAVVSYFGKGILAKDGTIDRSKLSQVVFQDKEKLLMVNQLTHPNVLMEVKREIEAESARGVHPYFIIETALMIESGYDLACDEVWYVHSSSEERRARLKMSRGYTDGKIDSIFHSQKKEEEFLRHFEIVIKNNGSVEELEEQIEVCLSNR